MHFAIFFSSRDVRQGSNTRKRHDATRQDTDEGKDSDTDKDNHKDKARQDKTGQDKTRLILLIIIIITTFSRFPISPATFFPM